MRLWLTSFFILFALVKFVEWARSLQVPFSAFVVAGVLLTIISNYDKRHLFPIWSDLVSPPSTVADNPVTPGPVEIAAEIAAERTTEVATEIARLEVAPELEPETLSQTASQAASQTLSAKHRLPFNSP